MNKIIEMLDALTYEDIRQLSNHISENNWKEIIGEIKIAIFNILKIYEKNKGEHE